MTPTSRSPAQLRNMFGSNLKRLCENYASISAVARDIGINRTQLNRYLSGESFPRPDILARICDFFSVDARVLLDPIEQIEVRDGPISVPFLKDFMGASVQTVPEQDLPNGFYQFSRRSFVRSAEYVQGLIYVKREGSGTFVRGYEPKAAMAMQGIPPSPLAREFRGFVLKVEDGLIVLAARRNGLTASINYLSRVPSFENNFWVGYVARTVRENASSHRASRLVYEYLGQNHTRIMQVARAAGFCRAEDIVPFHQRLLQPDDDFR